MIQIPRRLFGGGCAEGGRRWSLDYAVTICTRYVEGGMRVLTMWSAKGKLLVQAGDTALRTCVDSLSPRTTKSISSRLLAWNAGHECVHGPGALDGAQD